MEPLPPRGFWSYARADDRNSGGQISLLREKLASEIEILVGPRPPVEIWQDTSDIPGGSVWREQIGQAIAQASFFVAIVTPGFLHSMWCCQEVMRLRDREIELGRDDLIFPFLFADTGDLDPDRAGDCHDPIVFRLLRERQGTTFHDLRYYELASSPVRARVGGFASSIRGALRRPAPLKPVRSTALSPVPVATTDVEASIATEAPAAASELEMGRNAADSQMVVTTPAGLDVPHPATIAEHEAIRISGKLPESAKEAQSSSGPSDTNISNSHPGAPGPLNRRAAIPIWVDVLVIVAIGLFLYLAIQSDVSSIPHK